MEPRRGDGFLSPTILDRTCAPYGLLEPISRDGWRMEDATFDIPRDLLGFPSGLLKGASAVDIVGARTVDCHMRSPSVVPFAGRTGERL